MITEIVILTMLAVLLHSGRQQLLQESLSFSVGALTAPAVSLLVTKIDAAREQGCVIKKMKAAYSWSGKTAAEGPVLFGYSVGLSAAEILEALQADPQHIEDTPATEEANRKVFPVLYIAKNADEKTQSNSMVKLATVPIPWRDIPEGVEFNGWAFAFDDNLTAGLIIQMHHVYVTEWSRD